MEGLCSAKAADLSLAWPGRSRLCSGVADHPNKQPTSLVPTEIVCTDQTSPASL